MFCHSHSLFSHSHSHSHSHSYSPLSRQLPLPPFPIPYRLSHAHCHSRSPGSATNHPADRDRTLTNEQVELSSISRLSQTCLSSTPSSYPSFLHVSQSMMHNRWLPIGHASVPPWSSLPLYPLPSHLALHGKVEDNCERPFAEEAEGILVIRCAERREKAVGGRFSVLPW
jgi:hypothetical protein